MPVLRLYRIAENVGEFSYLDYLGEKTLANSLFQINTEIKVSVKLREKLWRLAINSPNLSMFSPANVFRYMMHVASLNSACFIDVSCDAVVFCRLLVQGVAHAALLGSNAIQQGNTEPE